MLLCKEARVMLLGLEIKSMVSFDWEVAQFSIAEISMLELSKWGCFNN